MAKLKDLKVTIGLSKKGLTKLNADLRRTKSNFRRNFGEIAQMAKRAAAVIVGTLVAAITAMAQSGAEMQRLEVGFRSITGGAEAASQMVARLNQFAASTPFQLAAISRSARQLLAVGTKESELTVQLRMLGDIAAASGNEIEEIAAIFAKVQAKGKVELENLNQLAERGVPIFKQLRKVTGDANMEFGAGAVSVEEFNAALAQMVEQGGFAQDSMKNLSETLSGQFSTLKDVTMQASASAGEVIGVTQQLQMMLGGLTRMFRVMMGLSDAQKQLITQDTAKLIADANAVSEASFDSTRQALEDYNKELKAMQFNTAEGSESYKFLQGRIDLVSAALQTLTFHQRNNQETNRDQSVIFKEYNNAGLETTRVSSLLTAELQDQTVSAKDLTDAYEGLSSMYKQVQIDSSKLQDVAIDEEILDEEDQDRIRHGNRLIERAQFAAENMGNAFKITSGLIGAAFDNIRDKSQGFHLYLKNMLLDLLQKAIALAAAFAAMSIVMGPTAMAKAGFGSFKAFMASGFGIPQMAEGGLFTGSSLALVGEGPGTSAINPEVVAPLDKLQQMMGGGNVTVTGRLDGRDILISSERAGFDRNRVRGF